MGRGNGVIIGFGIAWYCYAVMGWNGENGGNVGNGSLINECVAVFALHLLS